MPVVMSRVDQKLIHGQIISGWVPYLNVSEIVVVDEDTTLSPLIMSICSSGVPDGIRSSFLAPSQLEEHLRRAPSDKRRTMIIFKEIASVTEANVYPPLITSLNLAFFVHMPGTKCVKITPSFTAVKDELTLLNSIAGQGIELYAQPVPNAPRARVNPADYNWPWGD
jgi:PTS system mannose-specific IIB component